jgi:tetratricopeptide (TPR) repeat protein
MTAETVQQRFNHALRNHQTGRLKEAESIYRQILVVDPAHVDSLHYLGVLCKQLGDTHTAQTLIRQAIALRPNYAEAHSNLGSALYAAGNFDEAITSLEKALELNPKLPAAHGNLGLVLSAQGHTDEAIAAFHRALAIKPHNAEAHFNLGNSLKDKGCTDEAMAEYQKAIALNPRLAGAHCNLGNLLKDNHQVQEAIASFHRAIALQPGHSEPHNNLGNALVAQGKLQEAIAEYSMALRCKPGWATPQINIGHIFREWGQFDKAATIYAEVAQSHPHNAEAHSYLAMTLAELQKFDEAMLALDRAEAIDPQSALTHKARGIVQLRAGRGTQAVESFRHAVAIAPQSVSNWNGLGQALRQIGHFDEAADCARRALAIHPGNAQAHALLSSLSLSAGDSQIASLVKDFHDPQKTVGERATLGFALGKHLDDAARFDDAFSFYSQANALILEMRAAAGGRYSCELFTDRVNELIARFTPQFFAGTRDWGESSELPVFVVGMPRSGTSLVEQIAASHPDVTGVGELKDILNIDTELAGKTWQQDEIRKLAGEQLARLRARDPSAQRIIDKMPANVETLGLIATLFPRARIIICRRDPRDTCLSCFFQKFTQGNFFSLNLAHCGHHHVQTDRLIAHWLKVLPLPMLEVTYEAVVNDLESESRRIINFLGLPWDPKCLEFHRTERTVQTASDWQVRQPLYTSSVGRWRNHERHLQPLLAALADTPQ